MPDLPLNQVLLGDCLDVLRDLPTESVDSVVTDPPYGLGNKAPSVDEIIAYLRGEALDIGEFMNKDWQIPSVTIWRECLRVLKPGGFLLAFAGTRTMDLISIGIRAAGFENRDTMDIEMGPPVVRWLRAQGMPKSTGIGKAMVKRAPEQASEWKGYGTALKPYWEPVLIFRKPLKEKTVAEQVLATGTGAINIDGCRVQHASPEDFAQHKAGVDAIKAKGGMMANSWKNSSDLSGANDVSTAGRFPPNAIIVHSALCRKTGTVQTPMPPINRFDDGAKPFGGGAGHQYTTHERPDELVAVWDCHPSCPAHILNQQSDTGEVSKFFLNVETPCFYAAKPKAGEKNAGLPEGQENEHVSVKPVKLMRYLVRLVTRKGGLVLDPFCGSGTTCVAAMQEGVDFVGIEKEPASVETARIRVANCQTQTEEWDDLFCS